MQCLSDDCHLCISFHNFGRPDPAWQPKFVRAWELLHTWPEEVMQDWLELVSGTMEQVANGKKTDMYLAMLRAPTFIPGIFRATTSYHTKKPLMTSWLVLSRLVKYSDEKDKLVCTILGLPGIVDSMLQCFRQGILAARNECVSFLRQAVAGGAKHVIHILQQDSNLLHTIASQLKFTYIQFKQEITEHRYELDFILPDQPGTDMMAFSVKFHDIYLGVIGRLLDSIFVQYVWNKEVQLSLVDRAPTLFDALLDNLMTYHVPVESPDTIIAEQCASILTSILYVDHAQGHDHARIIHSRFLSGGRAERLAPIVAHLLGSLYYNISDFMQKMLKKFPFMGRYDPANRFTCNTSPSHILQYVIASIMYVCFFSENSDLVSKTLPFRELMKVYENELTPRAPYQTKFPTYNPKEHPDLVKFIKESLQETGCNTLTDYHAPGHKLVIAPSTLDSVLIIMHRIGTHDQSQMTEEIQKTTQKRAEYCKQRGNDTLSKIVPGHLQNALTFYNTAVALGDRDPRLCVYLANRAEALIRLGRFRDALWDATASLPLIETQRKSGPKLDGKVDLDALRDKVKARYDVAMAKIGGTSS
eukprot:TRINITY_DN8295_c0_g2_i2.p1 TRINITY_DN8295_c0_g2~~TRINITY_DN8295_c0_g2_i2.p1  ORF type:complete len:587 (-),score=67.27 TRINITY_DN8295_c0_g2_i2:26-1786(-)